MRNSLVEAATIYPLIGHQLHYIHPYYSLGGSVTVFQLGAVVTDRGPRLSVSV